MLGVYKPLKEPIETFEELKEEIKHVIHVFTVLKQNNFAIRGRLGKVDTPKRFLARILVNDTLTIRNSILLDGETIKEIDFYLGRVHKALKKWEQYCYTELERTINAR